jgi:hypothetical protein
MGRSARSPGMHSTQRAADPSGLRNLRRRCASPSMSRSMSRAHLQAVCAIQDRPKAHQFHHHEWREPLTPSTLIYEQVVHDLLGSLRITPCAGDTIRDARVRLHQFVGSTARRKRIEPTPRSRQDLVQRMRLANRAPICGSSRIRLEFRLIVASGVTKQIRFWIAIVDWHVRKWTHDVWTNGRVASLVLDELQSEMPFKKAHYRGCSRAKSVRCATYPADGSLP